MSCDRALDSRLRGNDKRRSGNNRGRERECRLSCHPRNFLSEENVRGSTSLVILVIFILMKRHGDPGFRDSDESPGSPLLAWK